MQRRRLLTLGIASGAVLIVAGTAATLFESGLRKGVLSVAGRSVFSAVGNAVLDKTLPAEPTMRQASLDGLLQRIDILIAALPVYTQGELSQLLSLLASAPGRLALASLRASWPAASVDEVQAALQGMRLSSLALRQQAYAALHDIVAGAYFSEPSSWTLLGYPGPLKI